MAITLPSRAPAASGNRRGRGVRLPKLGSVPTVSSAQDPGVSVNPEAFGAAAGEALAAVAPSILEISDRLNAAEQRIQSRKDAISRMRALGSYHESVSQELTRLNTEGDMSEEATAQAFVTFAQRQADQLLQGHVGSPESEAILATRLEGLRQDFSRQAAELRLNAERALVERTFDAEMSSLAARAYQSPGQAFDLLAELQPVLDTAAGALTPDEERAWMDIGRETIAKASLESLLDRGRVDDAQALLAQIPLAALGPSTRLRFEQRIVQTRQAEDDAAQDVRRKIAGIEAVLGPLSAAEKRQVLGIRPLQPSVKPTSLMQNLMSMGLQPGTPEWNQAMGQAITKPTVSIGGPNFGEAQAADAQQSALASVGELASRQASAMRMGDLLVEGIETGATQPMRNTIRGLADDLGIEVDVDALASAEEFQRTGRELTIGFLQNFKGQMSDKELAFSESAVAGLGASEQGNVKAIAAMQAAAERARENAVLLGLADNAEEVRRAQVELAQRDPAQLISRTQEIETELRSRMQQARLERSGQTTVPNINPPASADDVMQWSREEVQMFVERSATEDLNALDPTIIEALRIRLQE